MASTIVARASTTNPSVASEVAEPSQYNRPTPRRADVEARNATPFLKRPLTRLLPMRVLVLGLCRTGTVSMRHALLMLGYEEVYHMSSLDLAPRSEIDAWSQLLARKKAETRARQLRRPGDLPEGMHRVVRDGALVDVPAEVRDDERELVARWEREYWDRLLGHADVVADIPCALFAEELLRVYPEAKVILTVRGPDQEEGKEAHRQGGEPKHLQGARSFATSVTATIFAMRDMIWWMKDGLMSSMFISIMPLPRLALLRRAIFNQLLSIAPGPRESPEQGSAERLMAGYRAHNELVVDLCRKQGRDVLVYDAAEGWGPLVDFLGDAEPGMQPRLEIPVHPDGTARPFPRLNDTASFHRVVGAKVRAVQAEGKKKVMRMLAMMGALLVLVLGLLINAFLRR